MLCSVEGSNDPEHMNDKDSLHLIFGQRAVTEQTCNLFFKHISKIEVLTTAPENGITQDEHTGWNCCEEPCLSCSINWEMQIRFTTPQMATPTVNSPMFN